MHLIKKLSLLSILFICLSCELLDSEPTLVQEEFEDWVVLKVPNGERAYAVNGSIDEVLVVTTMTKVYATIDAGASWNEVANFQGPMPGLLQRNDSLFIFSAFSESEDFDIAANCMYFSTDKGLTWKEDADGLYTSLRIPIKYVEIENDVSYKIKENFVIIDGDTSNYIATSDIEKTINNITNKLDIPFEYILNNLHLDDENRLYVAASFGTVQDDGKVTSGDRNSPALVFISKNPLP